MNYELKFYYGPNTEDTIFLGSYALADENTYNHYLDLINTGVPFSIWFELNGDEFMHRNVLVDHRTTKAPGTIDNDQTKVIFILALDPENIKFLTHKQFTDQNKINELISQISKENISRYFK